MERNLADRIRINGARETARLRERFRRLGIEYPTTARPDAVRPASDRRVN